MHRDLDADLVRAEVLKSLVGQGMPAPRLGRFELQEHLGQGGMGSVYAAFDTERQQLVALKTLDTAASHGVLRFKREFRTLAELAHPNLAQLYELLNEEGQWYFTMEYVEGDHFLRYVRPTRCGTRRLDEARLRGALRQIVAALQHVHAAGILHRDLKPQNVLITAQARAVLLDFGLVTEPCSAVRSARITGGALLGTAAYVAPERAKGADASTASDFYALGVMLFEALTGRLPFDGQPLQVLVAKIELDAPSASPWAPDAPVDLVELSAQLLSRNPAERPDGNGILSFLDGA